MSDDESKFSFNLVVSRCQKEECRHLERDEQALAKSETAVLLAANTKPKGDYVHCVKHNNSSVCWKKYPHLAPAGHPFRRKFKALLTNKRNFYEDKESENVCLVGESASDLQMKPTKRCSKWLLDSGSSSHMTFNKEVFCNYSISKPVPVDLGSSFTAMTVGNGHVELFLEVNGRKKECITNNVQHAPGLRYQLLSVSVMTKLVITTVFNAYGATLRQRRDNKLIATTSVTKCGLHALKTTEEMSGAQQISLVAHPSIWHERFGGVCSKGIKAMSVKNVVSSLEIFDSAIPNCTGCVLGKGHRVPIPKFRTKKTKKLLEIVHSDVIGACSSGFKVLSSNSYLVDGLVKDGENPMLSENVNSMFLKCRERKEKTRKSVNDRKLKVRTCNG